MHILTEIELQSFLKKIISNIVLNFKEAYPFSAHFLANVSTVQNGMYRVRIIAASAMICTFIPLIVICYWAFYSEAQTPSGLEISGIAAMGGLGWILQKVYRYLAPMPW